jgi:outer membrane protein assembly factor BamB
VASLSLAGCWWQQPDFGPAHQRWNPFERTLTAETVAAAQVQWTVVVDGPSDMFEPITDGESVYVTLQLNLADAVRAYDMDTGTQVWNRNLPSSGAPTTVRAVPVAFSGDELVVSQLARFPTTVADCVDQNRLDPETGAVLGVARTEFATSPLVTAASIRAQTTSGRCMANTSRGRLRVDDATSGATWTADLGPETFAAPAVSLAEDLLYVNDHGVVRAYTASGCGSPSCSPLWSVAVPGFVGPVLVADGMVFAFENVADVAPAPPDPGLHHGAVIALDARTGAEVWRSTYGVPADGTSGQVYGIAASGDTLYVSATSTYVPGPHEGQLDAYSLGGCGSPACAPAWSAALDVPWPSAPSGRLPYVSPVVAGDVVYAVDAAGVVAFDTGGTRLVTLPLDDPPAWIAVSAGHVFAVVDTTSASLTAFGLP